MYAFVGVCTFAINTRTYIYSFKLCLYDSWCPNPSPLALTVTLKSKPKNSKPKTVALTLQP